MSTYGTRLTYKEYKIESRTDDELYNILKGTKILAKATTLDSAIRALSDLVDTKA